jgi:hypothetical protein
MHRQSTYGIGSHFDAVRGTQRGPSSPSAEMHRHVRQDNHQGTQQSRYRLDEMAHHPSIAPALNERLSELSGRRPITFINEQYHQPTGTHVPGMRSVNAFSDDTLTSMTVPTAAHYPYDLELDISNTRSARQDDPGPRPAGEQQQQPQRSQQYITTPLELARSRFEHGSILPVPGYSTTAIRNEQSQRPQRGMLSDDVSILANNSTTAGQHRTASVASSRSATTGSAKDREQYRRA